ncbi:UvrD-helicase domain-containing protein [filamentous cyanobacterium LEGE 11480]|uniref:DNA 3'-5' helicase n=1 Tax=Romeriopsis navalis LEGE 11480 TaxID=2777977 RepID=A0A928Z3H8_9CYAN|nr:UvrD-helicase domain-containing protein [Romeriopsis navalis]MBE9029223.1 UvrD-helicase domain-containing protein [Romeriopsis navalis LEGE 11480]
MIDPILVAKPINSVEKLLEVVVDTVCFARILDDRELIHPFRGKVRVNVRHEIPCEFILKYPVIILNTHYGFEHEYYSLENIIQKSFKLAHPISYQEIRGFIRSYEVKRKEILEKKKRAELEQKIRCQAYIRRQESTRKMRNCFKSQFLLADDIYEKSISDYLSKKEYREFKRRFIQIWIKDNLQTLIDLDQSNVVGSVRNNTQVVARAGSGKTSTLINRTIFLQKHCSVFPSELLLLTFNRKAAQEIEQRLRHILPDDIPHVMTFHALANAIVHPEEALIYDENTKNQRKSRSIQIIIDEYRQKSPFSEKIRDVMLYHFREDWFRIVWGGYDKSPEEMLEYRKSLPHETLKGDYVKSFGEKTIANFLFEHGIEYKYESNFWWDGRNYRPDFTIHTGKKEGVIIEYFGLKGEPDYDEMSQKKRKYWSDKAPQWQFLEFSQHDIARNGVEGFCHLLKDKLESYGLECHRLSEEAIWSKIKVRAIDRFTKAVMNFIQRCRKKLLSPDSLEELIVRYAPVSSVEKQFLELGKFFYRSYLESLGRNCEEDFDGLIQRAAEQVESGNTKFSRKSGSGDLRKIRYIMIDEYQDFSELFHKLIAAIQHHNHKVQFFCVGDDWQAINGFAGSDLRFYQNFDHYFSSSKKLHISTNYRSAKSIVQAGNSLMLGLGQPSRAHKADEGSVEFADLSQFEPTLQEREKYPGDSITPVLLRLIYKITQAEQHIAKSEEKSGIVLLARKNSLPWYVSKLTQRKNLQGDVLDRFLQIVRDELPDHLRKYISISTVHKYKGLEKQVVIILDAVQNCYPLIHPDSVFAAVLGDKVEDIVAEEQRLFYVALTRAIKQLFIITEKENISPFLQKLQQRSSVQALDWSDYRPLSIDLDKLTVKICNLQGKSSGGTFPIKEQLKKDGFKWQKPNWWKTYSAVGFVAQDLLKEATWMKEAHNIQVQVCDSQDQVSEIYYIDRGQW